MTVEQTMVRQYGIQDKERVIALWRACNLITPWNDPGADIERKLLVGDDLFLVAEVGQELVATIMGGYEGHRGWLNYLAVAPHCRGKGLGKAIVTEVEARLLAKGCPKINLQVRASNESAVGFYKALGFAVDDVISLGKRLIHDA